MNRADQDYILAERLAPFLMLAKNHSHKRMGSSMSVHINRAWCKGCGICVAFCPKEALSLDDQEKAVHNPELCVECGMCELYCPDLAVTVVAERKKRKNKEDAA